jgi:hypothetical protein
MMLSDERTGISGRSAIDPWVLRAGANIACGARHENTSVPDIPAMPRGLVIMVAVSRPRRDPASGPDAIGRRPGDRQTDLVQSALSCRSLPTNPNLANTTFAVFSV